jgi:hypothetical protein
VPSEDLAAIMEELQARVRNALQAMFPDRTPDVQELTARAEQRVLPYGRVGITEVGHSDFTISSDSLLVSVQVIAVVPVQDNSPQATQFQLARLLHEALLGSRYEETLLPLPSGRVARLLPTVRTAFLSDVEQMLAERLPDATSVVMTMGVELPLGGQVF